MAIDSTSTLAQVHAEYKDTADWDDDADIAKAKRFKKACRYLLLMVPKASKNSVSEVEVDPRVVQQQLGQVELFVASNSSKRRKSLDVDFSLYR